MTVSELNHQARITIEQRFNMVWVTGELSNFARPRSGHWYFTLKDDNAQVRCAMFVNRNRHARIQPGDGQQVVIRGRVSLYEGRGEFQIIVDQIEPAGEGALRRSYDALKLKLDGEGLFAVERKRALPRFARHVAVVSSASGAALHDLLAVWQRRFSALVVTLIPTDVQGAQAEPQLLAALGQVAGLGQVSGLDVDVVVVARGGGSLEDLWAFNLESVARAIAACPVPTISAIGHEIDVTIADFVADVRAPTPSAAAEMTVPHQQEVQDVLSTYMRDIQSAWRRYREVSSLTLENLRRGLISPQAAIEQAHQRTDDAASRVHLATRHQLARLQARLESLRRQLQALGPQRRLEQLRSNVANYAIQLTNSTERLLTRNKRDLSNLSRMLTSVSPLPTLARGYAVVRDESSRLVITSASQTQTGQSVVTHLADGAFTSTIDAVDVGNVLENPSS